MVYCYCVGLWLADNNENAVDMNLNGYDQVNKSVRILENDITLLSLQWNGIFFPDQNTWCGTNPLQLNTILFVFIIDVSCLLNLIVNIAYLSMQLINKWPKDNIVIYCTLDQLLIDWKYMYIKINFPLYWKRIFTEIIFDGFEIKI